MFFVGACTYLSTCNQMPTIKVLKMKKIPILAAALCISAASFAQTWNVDKSHAKIGFTVTHLSMSEVDGQFKNFDATINSSKNDFSDAVFTFTAQVNSISTENDQRDNHLKSPDFFDAAKFPTITFTSTSIKKTTGNNFKITGNLTMHGVTRAVTFDGSYRGPAEHPMSHKMMAGFKVVGKVKRTDFGISKDTPSAMLSDEVEIAANGEFQKG